MNLGFFGQIIVISLKSPNKRLQCSCSFSDKARLNLLFRLPTCAPTTDRYRDHGSCVLCRMPVCVQDDGRKTGSSWTTIDEANAQQLESALFGTEPNTTSRACSTSPILLCYTARHSTIASLKPAHIWQVISGLYAATKPARIPRQQSGVTGSGCQSVADGSLQSTFQSG
jgi:hypothetical protein